MPNRRNCDTILEQNKDAERDFFDRFVESRPYDVRPAWTFAVGSLRRPSP